MQHSHPRFARVRMVGCLALVAATGAMVGAQQPDAQQVLNLGLRGVYFVPNHGQWSDSNVYFGLHSRGLDVAFRESALTMHMAQDVDSTSRARQEAGLDELASTTPRHLTLTVTFPGSNAVEPIGAQPQTAKFNYFVGGEGRNTASNVPSFAQVGYENLYDGIDLHIAGSDDGVLKYEFHVAAGADYRQILIHYNGIDSLCIDGSGDLHINAPVGTLRDAAPIVWYADSETDTISAHFELLDGNTYRIVLDAPIDATREFIIDPDVQWARFLGGTRSDYGRDVAVDPDGNILVVGQTSSEDFEGRRNSISGSPDAFVVKLSSRGDLLWMTYLGGRSTDSGYGIVVDANGSAVITGDTTSPSFPGQGNSIHDIGPDAFIARLSSAGTLQGMLYLGGSSFDYGQSVALDSEGNAFVSGRTLSDDFDGRINESHGNGDAYVVKVSAAGTIEWMTYVGGSAREDSAYVAMDGGDSILVAGETRSLDFEGMTNEHHGGTTDSYAAKLDPSGRVQWMTYIGGSEYEKDTRVAVDPTGNVIVGGSTLSTDFEYANNGPHGNYDAFVAELDPAGAPQWALLTGGTDRDTQYAVAVDSAGNIFAAGETQSWDFEGQSNTKDWLRFEEAFVTKVTSDGALRTMSYIGGELRNEAAGIAVGADGRAIMAGTTLAETFEGQLNTSHGIGADAIAVSRLVKSPQLRVISACPSGGPIQVSWADATPGAPVALVYAPDPTWYVIPEGLPCFDSLLNIGGNGLRVVFRGTAGPNGSRTLNSNTVPGVCGKYLQLIELNTCDKSNVARIE